MTGRVSRKRLAAPDDGADDLEVLHPEREFELDGRKIVMREYGFVEGLRLAAQAAPVVQDLASLANNRDDAEGLRSFANLESVFARHEDALLALVAQACDQPVAWVRDLDDENGRSLLLAWWAVNGPFFVRRVITELQMRLAAVPSAGDASTPASSAPATAARNGSAVTPVVN